MTPYVAVVGPGRALVRVTADIDFKRHRKTEETYNPDGRVQKKESIRTLKTQSPASGARGPAWRSG